jgi:uncharacterized protein YecT (DUF1311 family)
VKATHWFTALCLCVAASSAYAQCSDLTRPECVRAQLEAEDAAINMLYSRMIETANLATGEQLRATQRQWLRDRNSTCNLAPGSTNSADWIAVLSREPSKALCVYGSTHARLEQLRSQSVSNVQIVADTIESREINFPISRSAGKWYAEARFLANYAPDDQQYMQGGAASVKMFWGTQHVRSEMRRVAGANGEYVLGLALDLDNGKLYSLENGSWRTGAPGSPDGIAITRGDAYTLRIASTGSSISGDLSRGFISINAGQAPFVHPMPAGYKPYFTPPAGDNAPRVDWLVPSYQKVTGLSLLEWSERYWAWLMPKTPARNPTQDTNGEFCADDQSGPVWFLAGGDAKSRIERTCRVPKGKFILLPALTQALFAQQGSDNCATWERSNTARDGADLVTNAHVSIDGVRFDALYDYRVFTPRCAPIRGSAGEIVAPPAIFYGVMVLLQPLPEGEHVISFGGDLAVMNNYRAATYRITVN